MRIPSLRTAALAAALVGAAPAGAALRFEQAFPVAGEPAVLHYRAEFQARGAAHQLEVWRDGQRRLRRRTDDAIDAFVTRAAGDAEYRMTVLDLKRHIETRIDRTNLIRIGGFIDWFDLAHGLKHPLGDYEVAAIAAPPGAPQPIGPCRWHELRQLGHATPVCWSGSLRLPLLILGPEGSAVWKVTAFDQKAAPAHTFDIVDEGFIRNDANQDLEGD